MAACLLVPAVATEATAGMNYMFAFAQTIPGSGCSVGTSEAREVFCAADLTSTHVPLNPCACRHSRRVRCWRVLFSLWPGRNRPASKQIPSAPVTDPRGGGLSSALGSVDRGRRIEDGCSRLQVQRSRESASTSLRLLHSDLAMVPKAGPSA